MLSGIHIICFAGSYTVALLLELTRPLFRSGIRGAIMLGFAAAGLFAHTVFLAYRIAAFYQVAGAQGSPLSIKQDWYLVAAWVLVVVYLGLTYFHPKTHFGVFLLPVVLGLIGVGTYWADPRSFAREPASAVWGVVHGGSILVAMVAVLVGWVAGMMYLGQAYRLKHKLPALPGLRLPSLEWLGRANGRSIGVAMVMMGVGIVAGIVLNLINYDDPAGRIRWNDPVVLTTACMFGWLVLSSALGALYRPAREGRRVAYFTLIAFAFLLIALAVVLWGNTQHGGGRRASVESRPKPAAAEQARPGAGNARLPLASGARP